MIVIESDTFFVSTYPNGEIESKRHQSALRPNQLYTRYYPNGNLMWSRYMEHGKSNGQGSYFNEQGEKVAEFMYKEGVITDTLFLSSEAHIMFGRMTYDSVVHGGMKRADGGSTISGGHGVNIYYQMSAYQIDTLKIERIAYKDFSTDYNGDFFICLEEDAYAFYPKTYDVKRIDFNYGLNQAHIGRGFESSWNYGGPYAVSKGDYEFIELHYHSVGYAP
ncbi:MAG: hypothetical protein JKY09_04290 [Crocinitomicaceae bacterium]|nr:hypothetical protein [Crocinitomicaceae bacterium]